MSSSLSLQVQTDCCESVFCNMWIAFKNYLKTFFFKKNQADLTPFTLTWKATFLLKCMQNVQSAANACGLGHRSEAFWSDTTAASPQESSACVYMCTLTYTFLPSCPHTRFHVWILLQHSLKLSMESIRQSVARGIRKQHVFSPEFSQKAKLSPGSRGARGQKSYPVPHRRVLKPRMAPSFSTAL